MFLLQTSSDHIFKLGKCWTCIFSAIICNGKTTLVMTIYIHINVFTVTKMQLSYDHILFIIGGSHHR